MAAVTPVYYLREILYNETRAKTGAFYLC